jgi:hypothetical protein
VNHIRKKSGIPLNHPFSKQAPRDQSGTDIRMANNHTPGHGDDLQAGLDRVTKTYSNLKTLAVALISAVGAVRTGKANVRYPDAEPAFFPI